ncbi:hypothetical protein [Gorillibacterium sp. CAU 1737]|uniref:hypothetical protein n=1 Tax=Gorillibacterium sp. CAU 1737 TaxID=3140362 RepID=UPI003260970F
MTTSHWISTFAIFAVLAFSVYGRKPFNLIRLLLPIPILAYFGTTYLKDIPTGGNNGWLLAGFILFGGLIGFVLVLLARVENDQKTGKPYITTGIPSLVVLSTIFLLRIGFIEWITRNGQKAYSFSVKHHFDLTILGPIFILMATAMVAVRVLGIYLRVKQSKSKTRTYLR